MGTKPQPGVPTDGPKTVAQAINRCDGSLAELTKQQRSVIRNKPREVLQYVAPPWRENLADEWNVKRIPEYVPTDPSSAQKDVNEHGIYSTDQPSGNSDFESR